MNRFIQYVLILLTIFSCTTPFQNPPPKLDLEPPVIKITSHSSGDIIKGTIGLSGTVSDDLSLSSIGLYVISYTESGQLENELGKRDISGTSASWVISIQSEQLSEGEKIFKIHAIDKNGKKTTETINLIIDNEGPHISILEPQPLDGDNFIEPFQAKVVLVDDVGLGTLTWELSSEDQPTIKISGYVTDELTSVYDFVINPSDFVTSNSGFEKGYCNLIVRCTNSNGVSTGSATKRLYIDFIQDLPVASIETPSALIPASAEIMQKDVTITGSIIDDDGVKTLEIRYIRDGETEPTVKTLEYPALPKSTTFETMISGLEDGLYTLDIRGTDSFDTPGAWSIPRYFRVSNNLPEITFLTPAMDSDNSGDITVTANISSPVSVNITAVSYKVNDEAWKPLVITPAVTYAFNEVFDSSYITADKVVRYYIQATDVNGSKSVSYIRFNVDNIKPQVTILFPAVNQQSLNYIFKIKGTASDMTSSSEVGDISKVELTFDHSTDSLTVEAIGTKNWEYDYDSTVYVPQGVDIVHMKVTAYDMLNNKTMKELVLNIDQSSDIPNITIDFPEQDLWIYGNSIFSGTADDDDGIASVRVGIDQTTDFTNAFYHDGNWTYEIFTEDFVDTYYHHLYCQAVDINGVTSDIVQVRFARDNMIPNIWINPGDNEAVRANRVINGNATQGNGNDTISSLEIKLVGKDKAGKTKIVDWTKTGLTVNNLNTANASYSYTLNTGTTWADGLITISIRAKDSRGREAVANRRLIIDTVNPIGGFSSPVANHVLTGASTILKGYTSDSNPSSGLHTDNVRIAAYHQLSDSTFNIMEDDEFVSGALSDWSRTWDISALDDGIYNLRLNATDRAGNSTQNVNRDVRVMHYPPTLTNLTLNTEAVYDYMIINTEAVITADVADDNTSDIYLGLKTAELYFSDKSTISTTDIPVATHSFVGSPETGSFSIEHTINVKKKYMIVRVIDDAGGFCDQSVRVQIDFEKPSQDFKYSSASYYPLYRTTSSSFGDTLWIKLDAIDDSDITSGTVSIKAGSAPGGSSISGSSVYKMGDVFKLDLKNIEESVIYVSYIITDRIGNQTEGIIPFYKDTTTYTINSEILNGFLDRQNLEVSGAASAGDKTVAAVYISDVDGSLDKLNKATGTSSWTYTLSSLPADAAKHYLYVVVRSSDGIDYYEKFEFYSDAADPVLTGLTLSDSETTGTITGMNLAGVIRIQGKFSDNYGIYLYAGDIKIEISVAGVGYFVPFSNFKKNADSTFDWYYDFDTTGLTGAVEISVQAFDGARRNVTESIPGYSVQ